MDNKVLQHYRFPCLCKKRKISQWEEQDVFFETDLQLTFTKHTASALAHGSWQLLYSIEEKF